ncbi:MAG: lysophospholipase [Acidiferrobacterales bacterium]|nr:lysophospholipase [Acidiferrobacterales bacterium]
MPFIHINASEFAEKELLFISQQEKLSGTLVYSTLSKPYAAVVFVHGSGAQTRNINLAKALAARGIATFVYDKRGVGKSGGRYEGKQSVSGFNINLLAEDATAALNLVASLPEMKEISIGLIGISQAGWIIPLAASKTNAVDFIGVWSGPVCKVSEEDIYSKFTKDKDGETVPSYSIALASRVVKYRWPKFLARDTDSSEDLSRLNIPSLWIYGAQDGSIPVDLSIKNIKRLKASGLAIDYEIISDVGHNNIGKSIDKMIAWIKFQTNDHEQYTIRK